MALARRGRRSGALRRRTSARSRSSPITGSGARRGSRARSPRWSASGYQAVTLGRVWQAWRGEAALPRRPVVLTFDDGYLSQYRTAARTLRAPRLAGRPEPPGRPPGRRRAGSRGPRCGGCSPTAGSSTPTRSRIPTSPRSGRSGCGASWSARARRSQREFGVTPNFFCFPYGHFDAAAKAAVRAAGYLAATTTRRGLARRAGRHRSSCRAISVSARTSPAALLRRLRAATR